MNQEFHRKDTSIDILTELIEIAIHCILFNRNLYPQGVFEKRIKFNVPVQVCLHPDVCAYIANIMESLKKLLHSGKVDTVSLVILTEDGTTPVEKFVFEVGEIKDKWKVTDPHLLQVEQAFRGLLLKLNVSDALLKQSSSESLTWTVHVHTKESTLASVEEHLILKDFPWMEAEEKQQTMVNGKIIPVKSMTSDVFNMQLYYVQEEEDQTS